MIWKTAFGILGLASFVYIMHGYGFSRLAEDLSHLGWWSIPLALSFLPTLTCYALAWVLTTPELPISNFFWLCRLMVTSVAWNNLSPFVKFLGEPLRLRMLSRRLESKAAARSTVLYNIVHMLGTLLSFFVGSAMILFFFSPTKGLRDGLTAFLVISPLLTAGLYFLPHLGKRWLGRSSHRNRLVVAGFWVRWGFSKIRIFSRRYPGRFWLAVLLEIAARFIEGVTFYAAFRALGENVSMFRCALLDVGRALVDNLFFFVPYQVGSREGGVMLLARDALSVNATALVGAAVMYRLVEIFWTGIGYLLWIQDEKTARSSQ